MRNMFCLRIPAGENEKKKNFFEKKMKEITNVFAHEPFLLANHFLFTGCKLQVSNQISNLSENYCKALA